MYICSYIHTYTYIFMIAFPHLLSINFHVFCIYIAVYVYLHNTFLIAIKCIMCIIILCAYIHTCMHYYSMCTYAFINLFSLLKYEEKSFKFTNAFTSAGEGSVLDISKRYRHLQHNKRAAAARAIKKVHKIDAREHLCTQIMVCST